MLKRVGCFALLGVFLAVGPAAQADKEDKENGKKIRVVIIDGQNNHAWAQTTPWMRKVLEESGRFTVDVCTTDKPDKQKPKDWEERMKPVPFPPDLSKYDVVLSNYNGAAWPKEFQDSLKDNLKAGKVALVIVHAANNSFGNWPDYLQMVGMGWYDRSKGDRLFLDENGKTVFLSKGEGDGPGHRYTGNFQVTIRDGRHPITKGMPLEWMHNSDELYDNMRGPIENVHLLATAYSKGTKAHEPMIWTVGYGKGRVFHTPMGHALPGMRCVGFVTTLQRGTEWAATGEVTLPIPDNFPTADKLSVMDEKKK